MDSQAKYAVLAAGEGDVLLRLLSPSRPDYREKIWDQAAGSIVDRRSRRPNHRSRRQAARFLARPHAGQKPRHPGHERPAARRRSRRPAGNRRLTHMRACDANRRLPSSRISGYDTGLPIASNGPRNCRVLPQSGRVFDLTPDAHVGGSPTRIASAKATTGHSRCATKEFSVSALVKELVEAGVHFGHRASRWNPKMRPYIYARKNLIHIIDVRETVRGLLRAKKYLTQISSQGSLVLFVGTKRQAADTDRARSPALRHAVRQRSLAGRHAHQLPHDPQPARAAGRAREDPATATKINSYSKKMQSALNREYRKMFRNLQRHPHDEPAARVPGHRRSEEGKERGQRGPEAGHRDGRADRHRLRSGPGRSADPRQRRQHAVDRADRRRCWPTRSWPARARPPSRANTPPKAPKSRWRSQPRYHAPRGNAIIQPLCGAISQYTFDAERRDLAFPRRAWEREATI